MKEPGQKPVKRQPCESPAAAMILHAGNWNPGYVSKLGVPYFGVLIIRDLLFRVLYSEIPMSLN